MKIDLDERYNSIMKICQTTMNLYIAKAFIEIMEIKIKNARVDELKDEIND